MTFKSIVFGLITLRGYPYRDHQDSWKRLRYRLQILHLLILTLPLRHAYYLGRFNDMFHM